MSPADGAIAVDPQARRREVAARLRALAERAQDLRVGAGHDGDDAEGWLRAVAQQLDEEPASIRVLISILREARGARATLLSHSTEGAYYRAVVAILDEAIALLRGLQ